LGVGDKLALERTRLANERTSLAYFRSFVVFLSFGIAIPKVGIMKEVRELGWGLLFLAPCLLLIGTYRFFSCKKETPEILPYARR
jgi:putative membrane protein